MNFGSGPPIAYQATLKRRPGTEFVSAYIFRPLGFAWVKVFAPLRVPPVAVVCVHTIIGIACGVLIGRHSWIAAAALLQVKTSLDGADGQLARATGNTTEIGRYADTMGDTVANVAIFLGLALQARSVLISLLWICGLVGLTLIMSTDFNVEHEYSTARSQPFRPLPNSSTENQFVLSILKGAYQLLFAPQDRALRSVMGRRFHRLTAPYPEVTESPNRTAAALVDYHDLGTHQVLANYGYATQLLFLGAVLLLRQPHWYLLCIGLQMVSVPLLQLRRERRLRAVLATQA
jgi:archaetidylinositol phosphate synthase